MRVDLRTGFFKSEPYLLEMAGEKLILSHAGGQNGKNPIAIPCADIVSIVVDERFPAEIEIKTKKEVFVGIVREPDSLREAVITLKAVFGSRFFHAAY